MVVQKMGSLNESRIGTDNPTLQFEVAAIERQQHRFGVISVLAILVSFVHMAAALALFSGPNWYELGAALAMTALVDVATWAIVEYQAYARRRRLSRSRWVQALFGAALVISMTLNGAYLYAHRPAADRLPEWLSLGIALAFAAFVPLLIGVASLARGELEDDRLRMRQVADATGQERIELQQLRSEHLTLIAERAQLLEERAHLLPAAQDSAQLRAALAQRESEAAQQRELFAQKEREIAQLRAGRAQYEQEVAQEHAAHAQVQQELARLQEEVAQVVSPGALDILAIARRLRDLGVPSRETAQLVGLPESTLRSRLKQA